MAGEKITLDLELVNKVSQPAKSAVSALRGVSDAARKASQTSSAMADRALAKQITNAEKVKAQQARVQAAMQKAEASTAKAAERATAKRAADAERSAKQVEKAQMRSIINEMRANQRAMRESDKASAKKERDLRRMTLLHDRANRMNEEFDKKRKGGFWASFSERLPFRSIGDYAKGEFWGKLAADGVEKIVSGFVEGAKMAAEIVYEGISRAFEAGSKREQLALNYRFLLGSKEKGDEALADIDRFSGKTRYDDDEIAEMMRPLFNAGFRGTGARSAFAAASDLNAAGLGETQDFLEQITRIKLRGGVQERQLAGMGVSVPDFAKAIAKALHTDTKTAMTRAQAGTVDPQLLLNTIYEGIEKRQGGQLGTATEAMGQTMGARWHKLGQLPDDYLKTISQSPAWKGLSDRLGGILDDLNPNGPKGQKIITALLNAFDRLATLIQRALTPENIERFVNGLEGAAKAAGMIADAFATIFGSYAQAADDADYFNKLGGGDSQKGVAAALAAVDPSKRALADSAWDKVSKAEGIGWWRDLNMEPEERRGLIAQGYAKGEISEDEYAAYGAPSPHRPGDMTSGGGGVVVNQNGQTFNVTVAPGQDPRQAGKEFSAGMNATTVRQMERAAQERGSL